DVLSMEEEVRRPGGARAAGASAAPGGEPQAQATGGRPEPGPHDSAGEPEKKILRPAVKREWVRWVQEAFQVPQRRACRPTGVARSLMLYRHRRPRQEPLRRHLKELAEVRVSYGYRRLHVLLRRQGWAINHKRVYRLYREEGLALRRKRPKRRRS